MLYYNHYQHRHSYHRLFQVDPAQALDALSRYWAKYGRIQCPCCGKKLIDKEGLPHDEESFEKLKRIYTCGNCGEQQQRR